MECQSQPVTTIAKIPDTRGAVARAGDDQPAVPREVERVYLLLVSIEDVADPLFGDIPDLCEKAITG